MQTVVGLGGSAGSIKALQAFFSRMPVDSGLAFVVVLHLSPEHESSLAALLQNVTPMRVVQVSEAVKVFCSPWFLLWSGMIRSTKSVRPLHKGPWWYLIRTVSSANTISV